MNYITLILRIRLWKGPAAQVGIKVRLSSFVEELCDALLVTYFNRIAFHQFLCIRWPLYNLQQQPCGQQTLSQSRIWLSLVSMLVSVCQNMCRRSRLPMAMSWRSWYTQMASCLWLHFLKITPIPSLSMLPIYVVLIYQLANIGLR